MTADYTISVDQGSSSKEIVKCLVAGTTQNASVTVYGRTNLAGNLINLTATVNNSRVSLIARAITGDCKIIYSVNYYQTLSTPLPAVSSIIPIIPTYSVAPNINSAIESDTIVYTVTTTDVDDNTVLYWINSGTTSSADFDDAVDSGTVTIVSNVGTILRTLVTDLNTEGDETVVIEIRNGSTTGELLAISTPTVVSDTSVDPTTPQYAVAPSTLTATEGTTVTFTVTTTNVADGTTLYWSNEGTTNGATDFAYPGSNNGTFVITGGVGTVDITLVNDLTTEGPENIIFKVRTGSITGVVVATSFTVTVLDTSIALTQSYDAAPNLNSILEGNGVTYTITTSNVPDNTTLYWTNSGTTVSSDFNDFSNNGSFTIINNVGYVTRTLKNDLQTEGSETIILEIRTSSVVGPIVATAPDVTVIDSSTGSVIASYAISPSASFVNEGGTINYTVTTSNVADGTNLYWTNSGTTVDVDFTDNSNNGFVGINSGTGVISRTLKNDLLTEGTETVILQLRTNSIIGSVVAVASTVTINDSSTG
jgi:plastocyanin